MKNPEQKTSPFKALDHFFLIASIALILFALVFEGPEEEGHGIG